MYSMDDTPKGWVAPFGHPGIKACSRLLRDFRSVPRPSSPLGAKASTRCPSHAQTQCVLPMPERTPTMRRNNQRRATHRPPVVNGSANTANAASLHACTHSSHAPEPCNRRPARPAPAITGAEPGQTTRAAATTDPSNQPPNQTRHSETGQKPPELSCAPRSAPEPDSPVKTPPPAPQTPSPAQRRKPGNRHAKPNPIP